MDNSYRILDKPESSYEALAFLIWIDRNATSEQTAQKH